MDQTLNLATFGASPTETRNPSFFNSSDLHLISIAHVKKFRIPRPLVDPNALRSWNPIKVTGAHCRVGTKLSCDHQIADF